MKMHLDSVAYEAVASGTKTIEMRLNDEKRRELKVGDVVEFINRATKETLKAKIKELHVYKNFEELYKHHDKASLGYKSDEIASPSDMRKYYSFEDTIKNGVVGIEIEVI